MIIHACDLCGSDLDSYRTWVEVPLNVEGSPRVAIKHPAGRDTTFAHFRIIGAESDMDLCAACFRDTLRRYLAEETKPVTQEPDTDGH